MTAGLVPDPTAIHATRRPCRSAMARALHGPGLPPSTMRWTPGRITAPTPIRRQTRALRNAALALLTRIEGPDRARAHYDAATNMTDEIAAFTALLEAGDTDVARRFHDRWKDDRLVMDKWFMAQIAHAAPDRAVATARGADGPSAVRLDQSQPLPVGDRRIDGGQPGGVSRPLGAGYAFLADWLIRLDAKNPQTAARMSTAFETWRAL
jgi:aminopeptidase N